MSSDQNNVNRRHFLKCAASVGVAGPLILSGRTRANATPNHAPENDPRPMVEGFWSMILMPDTQYYVYNFRNYGVERLMTVFRRQTEWIAQQAEKRRIKMVLHLGDVVDHNDNDQFVNARKAMSILDGVVPVAYTLGNHDYGPRGNGSNRQTFFNDHFSASDNPLVDPEKGGTLKGVYEEGKLDNS